MMGSRKDREQSSGSQDRDRGGILDRIEDKLNHLLGRRDDEWRHRGWAPLDSPFVSYRPGDPSPRFFGGPPADAPGWDPGLAPVVSPSASYPGAQAPLVSRHNTAREYYLLMRARDQADAHDGTGHYDDYRRRKMDEFNREYADYRRDQQDCFDRDFEAWREKRKSPPQAAEEPRRAEPKSDELPMQRK